jgi:PAS domain S-box-containing protein
VLIADGDGRFVDANAAALRLLGYDRDDLLSLAVPDIVVKGAEWAKGEYARLAREGRWRGEMELRRHDGSVVPVEARAVVLPSPAGPILASFLRDRPDERRAATLRLRDTAIAAASSGIVITDPSLPDNPIVDANPAFFRMTGYRPAEVIGHNCRFLQGTETEPEAVDAIREGIRSGRDTTVTLLNYRKDRMPFWNELHIAPVRDDDGGITHFVAVQTDVTARVRAAELEAELAAERTANRLKDQFLATVSHELRTPMNGIIGHAHLLLDGFSGPLAPEQTADIRQIAVSADRLLKLIDDILDLTGIDASMEEFDPAPIDIGQVVEAVRSVAAPQAAEKGLDLVVEAAGGLPAIEADAALLQRALLVLVDNAVKFTERGSVGIAARPAGDGIELEVEDTGPGIRPELLPRMFEGFRQADGSATRRHGGLGLGLAVAQRIATLHGGTVLASSEPGTGSRFTLRLPIRHPQRTGTTIPVPHGRATSGG